jgi:hypothetical protein
MEINSTKKPGGFEKILQGLIGVLHCVRIAIDIIRLLRTGFV